MPRLWSLNATVWADCGAEREAQEKPDHLAGPESRQRSEDAGDTPKGGGLGTRCHRPRLDHLSTKVSNDNGTLQPTERSEVQAIVLIQMGGRHYTKGTPKTGNSLCGRPGSVLALPGLRSECPGLCGRGGPRRRVSASILGCHTPSSALSEAPMHARAAARPGHERHPRQSAGVSTACRPRHQVPAHSVSSQEWSAPRDAARGSLLNALLLRGRPRAPHLHAACASSTFAARRAAAGPTRQRLRGNRQSHSGTRPGGGEQQVTALSDDFNYAQAPDASPSRRRRGRLCLTGARWP